MKFSSIFDRILGLFIVLAGVLVIFAMVITCAEVVMRYFLNQPIIWVSEIAEICLVFICFLGTAWLLKNEGHVTVDIVSSRVNSRVKALLGIISSAIGIFICTQLIWYGALNSVKFTQQGIFDPTVLELPKGPLLAIIPIGSFLLLIQFLRRIYDYWHRWRSESLRNDGKYRS